MFANLYAVFTGYAGYRSGYLSNHYQTYCGIDINDNGQIGIDELFLAQDQDRIKGCLVVLTYKPLVDHRLFDRSSGYKWFQDD